MPKIKYDGHELEYFDSAYNFRNYQLQLIKKYLKGNLAEVGPGKGEFFNYYKKYLNSIKLIEPDKKLFLHLKKKYKKNNVKIENKTISKIKNKFQSIIYFDVLEHIKNDLKEVKDAKKKLVKNGFLIFSVPAFQTFYNDFDKSVGHFKRYNKKDFKKISSKTNLKIEKLIYYDSFGLLLLILNKIFSISNKNLKDKVKIWNFFIPLSRFIDLVTFNRFGKSLICIFKNVQK
jgi:2-polyprenyl-3-methyl-5-hydroxy-6-metoxy-1,4-benzoquinol methylase